MCSGVATSARSTYPLEGMPRRHHDKAHGQRSQRDEAEPRPAGSPKSRFNRFISAVSQGDVAKVTAILDDGFEIDTSSPRTEGFTGLHFASQEGDEPMVSLLLSRGASLDLRTRMGLTALMLASNFGQTAIVKRLLAAGALVEPREPTLGANALMMASSSGHTQVVAELLGAGAPADQVGQSDWDGKTAIVLALEGGFGEIIDILAPVSVLQPAQGAHILALLKQSTHESAKTQVMTQTACGGEAEGGSPRVSCQLL